MQKSIIQSRTYKGDASKVVTQTFTSVTIIKNKILTWCAPTVTMNGEECHAQYGCSSEECPAF